MPLPDAVKRIAACADGKSVRVVGPDGEYELSSGEPAKQKMNDDVLRHLLERDARLLETMVTVSAMAVNINAMAKLLNETILALKSVMESVASGQVTVGKSVEQLEAAFYTPVIPVYDSKGKLKAAQRIKRSGD